MNTSRREEDTGLPRLSSHRPLFPIARVPWGHFLTLILHLSWMSWETFCPRKHVIGGLHCRFDTSATSLCSRKGYLPSWSSGSTLSRSEKMDSHRKWAATVESHTLSWYSSVTRSVGGVGVYLRHVHVSCCIRFPPIITSPFPLMLPFSWFYSPTLTGALLERPLEPSRGRTVSGEQVEQKKKMHKCFSRTSDSLMGISNFASSDA